MKKRILALALVVVTLVLALTGCAYRYDKKNMSKLASVDAAAFEAFLTSIEIEGSTFGPFDKNGDQARKDKVLEEIDSALSGKIKTDAAKLEDVNFGLRQKITYSSYWTYEKDGVTYIFDTTKMSTASDKVQTLNAIPVYKDGEATQELKGADDLTKAIFAALTDKLAKDYAYKTETAATTEIKEGDLVFVTYSYSYTETEGGSKKTVTADYEPIEAKVLAEGAKATCIAELIGGKKISEVKATADSPLTFMNGEIECSVNSISVHFVSKGEKIPVEFTVPAEKKVKDIFGAEITIAKDEKVTYFVYPVDAKAFPAQTAENVVELIYGENITTSSLPCFGDTGMKELIENVLDLKEKKSAAETAYNNNKDSDALKTAKEDAEKAYNTALEQLPTKLATVKSGAADVIMFDYKLSVYDTLESTYDAEILEQLTAAIWAWAEKNITVSDVLPKSAVKEAKNRILAGHKNDYYTGTYSPSGSTSSSEQIPYVDKYKTFDEYLAQVAYKDANADEQIEATAKAEVKDLVRVYALAELYKGKIDKVRNSDIAIYVDRLSAQMQNIYYQFGMTPPASTYPKAIRETYGDTALRAALTMDNILNYVLETELVDDTGAKLAEDAADVQKNAAHVQYVKIQFSVK